MPHVAHLTTVHHPQDPRIFHKQCKTLRDAGYGVHLVAQRETSATVDGIRIHALPVVEGRRARLRLQPYVYRIARSIPASVYHIHDPELIPLLWLLKQTTGAVVIYDMHEDYRGHGPVQGRMLRALERWAFQWVDHTLTAEASYARVCAGHAYSHLPNYHKPYRSSPSISYDTQAIRPIYTGVISEKRGLLTMIELARKMKNRKLGTGLEWVGVCYIAAQRKQAEKQIEAAGLSDFIERIGWDRFVAPEAIETHYRRATVGLCLMQPHPNYVDSLPTKMYEYLHHGLPIICSDFPLWRDFIERYRCGAVVPAGDALAAAQVLSCWRDHPQAYRNCAHAARQAALKFQWKRVAPTLVSVYRCLLADA